MVQLESRTRVGAIYPIDGIYDGIYGTREFKDTIGKGGGDPPSSSVDDKETITATVKELSSMAVGK